jgi:hypothetical protein
MTPDRSRAASARGCTRAAGTLSDRVRIDLTVVLVTVVQAIDDLRKGGLRLDAENRSCRARCSHQCGDAQSLPCGSTPSYPCFITS